MPDYQMRSYLVNDPSSSEPNDSIYPTLVKLICFCIGLIFLSCICKQCFRHIDRIKVIGRRLLAPLRPLTNLEKRVRKCLRCNNFSDTLEDSNKALVTFNVAQETVTIIGLSDDSCQESFPDLRFPF